MTDAWDRETDLLVAGAGPAGMAAALVAATEGLEVVVCEKTEQVGGTGATSAGTLWIPGNRQSRDAGYTDSPDDAARYLDGLIGAADGAELRAGFLSDGPDAIDYLVSRAGLRFVPCGEHPDYRNNQPGAAIGGRAIVPEIFDGRLLGEDFDRVRPPIDEFMLFGGMMVSKDDIGPLIGRYASLRNLVHAARLVLRYAADRLRYRRGTRLTMGNALVARLFYGLRERGVPVLFGAPVVELIRDGGRVVGAAVGEDRRRIRARRGVVLATGGFAHNPAFRAEFMPASAPPRSMAAAANAGDGLEMARRAGAGIRSGGHRSSAFWSPVSVTRRRDGGEGLFPHLSLDRAKPGLIAVNSTGRRFVNEAASYHDFVEGMYRSHEVTNTMPAWLVCDSAFVRRYGLGAIHPGTRRLRRFADYVATAGTVAELASLIEVDQAGLADTVARHNRFAAEGSDPDFGKGDDAFNRFNGDPRNKPNPCLAPIETPPFVAVAVWPAEIGCSVGLATTADGEVLNADGAVIEGLYACGNDMSSVMAGTYPGPGITLGPAVVFGYRIALHAASRAPAAGRGAPGVGVSSAP